VAFNARLPWWGGDLQTIRNYALNARHAMPSQAAERFVVPLEDGSGDQLVAALHLPEAGASRPLVVLVHGIAGSENSCYMRIATAFFLVRGYPVLLVNQRGAGPSRMLCRRQYHAGSSVDFATLIARLDPRLTADGILPIGFSLGGNMLLKFLGGIGRDAPVRRAATVSAPLDLAASCCSLLRWRNFGYHRYIMAHLRRNCTAPGAELTERERSAILTARNLWQLDETFTAPRNGYPDAQSFYEENSSQRFLDRIRHATLVIHAKDDPFVPAAPYLERAWARQPKVVPLLPDSGGHLGFHDPLGVWHLRQIEAFFQGG
jgi:hypothetical protein